MSEKLHFTYSDHRSDDGHHHRHRHHSHGSRSGSVFKRIVVPALCLIVLGAAVLCVTEIIGRRGMVSAEPSPTDTSRKFTVPYDVVTATREAAGKLREIDPGYICPVDFDSLKQQNPDIYAWITVPGTNIDYPVLRREGDDSYYLNHDQDHGYSIAGALFTETEYNSASFDDPVTVIYGHRMDTDTMFGMLQRFYSDPENLAEYDTVTVFTPEKGFRYRIFAAVPHSDIHLLDGADYTNAGHYKRLLTDILGTTAMGSSIDPDYELNYDHKILILSTCYRGDITRRFLVCAYLETVFEK